MKKILIALMFVFPLLTNAQTAQEQYESALRQVIVLLQQQVTILINQLNALNAQTASSTPAYSYTPIVQTPIVVPELPVVLTPNQTQVMNTTPVQNFGSAQSQPQPDFTLTELSVYENVSNYTLRNSTSTSLIFTKARVTVTPKTLVNSQPDMKFEVVVGNNNKVLPFIETKPALNQTSSIELPVDITIHAGRTEQVRVEVSTKDAPNANDRYEIKLISLE